MHFTLLVDTSDSIVLGLADINGLWVQYLCEEKNKKSWFLHEHLYRMLANQGIKLNQIKECVSVAGPGSYTGIRLGHGLSQILSWNGIPTYSFHHFEVPKMLGVQKGAWITSAYKGEWFIHEWSGDQWEQRLLSDEENKTFLSAYTAPVFAYWPELLTPFLEGKKPAQSSVALIREQFPRLREWVVSSDQRVEPHYFRPLEKEFRAHGAKS